MNQLKKIFSGTSSIWLILLVFVIVGWILSPNFLTETNLLNIVRQVAVITILAYGAMTLIIGGMIDLSAGAVMALAGVMAVQIYKDTGSLTLAIVVGILVGIACNLINAVVVASFKTPAFIVTLGMMLMARGLVLEITDGQNILQLGSFTKIAQADLLGIPLPGIFLALITVGVAYLMNQTRYGRALYAVGGNEIAARAAGINITRTKYQAFIVNGALVGFAGVVFMARVNAGLPNAGVGYELQAITAPIIGGTSFSGGIGTVGGTLAGALIVGVLGNIMNLIGVGSYIQSIVMGAIIVLAVMYDVRSKGGKKGNIILSRKDGPKDGTESKSASTPTATASGPSSVGSGDGART